MKTLANINDNINIKFNNIKTINVISENAESQQVAGNRAEEQEEKMNLRIIKIKPVGNAKMFRTLAKAIAAGDRDHPCRRGWMRICLVRNP